jgi:hypothetical protein
VELTACSLRVFVKGSAGSALIRAAAHFYVIRIEIVKPKKETADFKDCSGRNFSFNSGLILFWLFIGSR